MIDVLDNRRCCGCNACIQACPHKCIGYTIDNEGFKYPVVDKEKCTNCHLCEKVCPMLNIGKKNTPLSVEAMRIKDEAKRIESSSGGIFTALAEEVIRRKGVVFGASFTEDWNVVHTYTETIEGLKNFRGSKYVQCDTQDAFQQVKYFLLQDRWVLFSGTPCQVRALHLFLRKPAAKLLSVDFICHGVPSHKVLMSYLREEIQQYARKRGKNSVLLSSNPSSISETGVPNDDQVQLRDIRFRDKTLGWKKFSFALTLAEASADGKSNTVLLPHILNNSAYMRGFGANLYLRPSCHECPAKGFTSGSDFTLADYWRIEIQHPEMDDDKGTSLVAIHTPKAEDFLSNILCVERKKVDSDEAYRIQYALYRSMPIHPSRSEFWASDWKNDFICIVNRIVERKTVRQRIILTIKFILRTIGVKKLLSKFSKRYI